MGGMMGLLDNSALKLQWKGEICSGCSCICYRILHI